jgi:hypothetical protein
MTIVKLLESLLENILGGLMLCPAQIVAMGLRPVMDRATRVDRMVFFRRPETRRNTQMWLTRTLRWLGVAAILWATLMPAGAAWARTVKLEAAEPLSDASDPAVERALKNALDSCVRRATAMGLAWIWLQDATVLPNRVIVKMVASDEDPDEAADEDQVHVIELSRVRTS